MASVVAGVRLALVDEQIAEIKSRLQRTNPVDDADAYLELFGDLVPLEQYRIALREKAMGAVRMSSARARERRDCGGCAALLGGDGLPEGFPGAARAGRAGARDGADARRRALVVTSWGLWVPEGDGGPRRARLAPGQPGDWKNGALAVVEAAEVEEIDGRRRAAADRPARRFRLAEPGRVPEVVHARVEGSIRSRHHRDLPGGGAWFVQRRIAGPGRRRAAGAAGPRHGPGGGRSPTSPPWPSRGAPLRRRDSAGGTCRDARRDR